MRNHRGCCGACGRWAVVAALVLSSASARAIDLNGGAGRWAAGGYAEGYAIVRGDWSSQRQRPAGTVGLNLSGDVRPEVRTYLDVRTTFGGPPEHAEGIGVVNTSDVFQNISPAVEFEEGYVDILSSYFDLRIGKQKVAWGRLDTFQPTDVISPRRFTDPFVMEETDAKIGVPALRASYFPPDSPPTLATQTNLSLVWVPFPVTPRFPLEDERWFPPAAAVPSTLTIPAGALGSGFPKIDIDNDFRTENASPLRALNNGAVGVRLSGLSNRADWSLYYYQGPETAPAFDLHTTVVSPSAQARIMDGITPGLGDLTHLSADATLTPRFGRIRLGGADLAFPVAGFTARAEAAYGRDRLLPRTTDDLLSPDNIAAVVRPQLDSIIEQLLSGKAVPVDLGDLFVVRDIFEWGTGVDYPYRGWVPVLQVNQTVVLNNSTNLLINDVDTRLFAAVVSVRSKVASTRNCSLSTPPSVFVSVCRWKAVARCAIAPASGRRSPASCSTVKRSNGRSSFTASITQSR